MQMDMSVKKKRDKATKEKLFARLNSVSAKQAPQYRHLFASVETFVLFIGYPRSGHSLIGALLNAHKHAVIAHELHALKFVERGFSREQLYYLLLQRDRKFTEAGSRWVDYTYAVPNQWQGRFTTLRVIGDKKGDGTGKMLVKQRELFWQLRELVGVPIRVIHVVRNPFDNISTICRRSGRPLNRCIQLYFSLCEISKQVIEKLAPEEHFTFRYEQFLQAPEEKLRQLCAFLGLDCYPGYLEDCAGIVFKSPTRTRFRIEWPQKRRKQVEHYMKNYVFLQGYTFDD